MFVLADVSILLAVCLDQLNVAEWLYRYVITVYFYSFARKSVFIQDNWICVASGARTSMSMYGPINLSLRLGWLCEYVSEHLLKLTDQ